MASTDLGFAAKCESWQLQSRMFPSKIGGKPAWLSLEKLPSVEDLHCNMCKKQMIFLCQIYAPYEEDDNNFHRTVFVFACTTTECCKRNLADNFRVFRSSLKRINNFYPYEPPKDEPDPNFDISKWVQLCSVCGCVGDKKCGKCKAVSYCAREHQVIDWKDKHKNECGNQNMSKHNSSLLFPEFEILIEDEELKESKEVDETVELEKFKSLEAEGKTGTLNDVSEAELQEHAKIDMDKTFAQFRKRVAENPDQVLRYSRGGFPLWIAKEPKPMKIPKCECCGGERQFEFQIMPQLLSILKENSLDWGVLLIYTCKSSCTQDASYKKEFIFKQDVALDSE